MSFKRTLTDDPRDSLAASNLPQNSTPDDDIAARLRSIGARVRQSVTEGYISAPSSFSRASSTGSIFQSARDSLREAQSLQLPAASSNAATHKRSRPQGEQGYNSDGDVDEDQDAEMNLAALGSTAQAGSTCATNRPIKALRKPRKAMLQTRSLPASTFQFSAQEYSSNAAMNKVDEEDDWSTGNFAPQGLDS
ncbi:hypothetical protein H0H92_000845 [Tricholoma furcatifolium]|nr:hypothetical protein H0H92_000845 [Tricholoma furcatifolium]